MGQRRDHLQHQDSLRVLCSLTRDPTSGAPRAPVDGSATSSCRLSADARVARYFPPLGPLSPDHTSHWLRSSPTSISGRRTGPAAKQPQLRAVTGPLTITGLIPGTT
ncbi:hypothetical protein NDU88_002562 [Pleurodeles waltl]|uniref:Uncharacterized protein n=1 Tax=Pleurodeles waltl TaxID=8319 RepID=A0AAV7UXF3_PLEWA|nr:hypothetical protein NDU88_002562 [Pleurodeles waltl]